MSKISINVQSPDFELADFTGKTVKLSDYKRSSNVLLVFNRGFM